MTRSLWFAVPAVLLLGAVLAPDLRADGVNLAWSECAGSSRSTGDLDFSCDDDSPVFTLVGSFVAPAGISKLTAQDARIDVFTEGASLPDWWALGVGGCRSGSLSAAPGAPGMTACAAYWGNGAAGTSIFFPEVSNPGHALLIVLFAVGSAAAKPLIPGREYYAFTVQIDARGAQGDHCAGCKQGACLVVRSLLLYQPVGMGNIELASAALRSGVSWRGGTSNCPAAKPVRRSSWGAVKSNFR